METILDTLFLPYVTQLGMKRTETRLHKKYGCTFLCDNKSASGFFWAYYVKDLFSISVYDVDIMENMSPRYNHPACFTIGVVNRTVSEYIVGKRRAASGIISYAVPDGTFSGQMQKGTHVSSAGISLTPKYLKKLVSRFHIGYEQLVGGCVQLEKAQMLPDVELVIKQTFAARPAPGSEAMYYEGKIMEMLSMILGWNSEHSAFMPDDFITDDDLERLEKMASYLRKNYRQAIGIEKLENIAYMGKTKLSFLFKQRYGMSVMEYLRKQRIESAKAFLSDTAFSIDKIASMVGYQNQGSFAERFKLETGLTPTEFRKLALCDFLPHKKMGAACGAHS